MRNRGGFTLVEMMVAMALTIFVMVILTEAFVLSIDTFVGLKGIGDMQENLRAGANVLRADLQQYHLEGARRVSDPTLPTAPPREGFFVIFQGAASTSEGVDGDNMPSSRATTHVLQFTSRLKGNQQQSFYTTALQDVSAPLTSFFQTRTFYNMDPTTAPGVDADATLRVPANGPFYRSQWAEIVYFLGNPNIGAFQPIGSSESAFNPNVPGTLLFGLYRAQYVAATDTTKLNANAYPAKFLSNFLSPAASGNFGVACGINGSAIQFYSPQDLASGTRTVSPSSPTFNAASLVVPNVISFQVRAITSASTAPQDLSSTFPATYDTASASAPLQGVAITLRVWDVKTRQSRQLTIMQDL